MAAAVPPLALGALLGPPPSLLVAHLRALQHAMHRALRFVLRSMDDLDDVMRDRRRPTESKEELVDALRAARRRGGFPAPVREEGEAEDGEEEEASKGDDARGARMRRMADDAAELDAESLGLLFRGFDRDGDGRSDAEREWAG